MIKVGNSNSIIFISTVYKKTTSDNKFNIMVKISYPE